MQKFRNILKKIKLIKQKQPIMPETVAAELTAHNNYVQKQGKLPPQLSQIAQVYQNKVKGIKLNNVLSHLGFVVFKASSVEKYQQAVETNWQENVVVRQYNKRLNYFLVFSLFIFTAGLIILFKESNPPFKLFYSLGIVMMLFGILGIVIATNRKKVRYSWYRIPFNSYSLSLSRNVSSLVARIKEQLPQASFWIEEFSNGKYTSQAFLIVSYGDREYYIGIWDEPAFKED